MKRGGKVTSSVDSRISMTTKPLGFKFNTNFTLEVQPVDISLVADLRRRKTECQGFIASSPIITMTTIYKRFIKPITITLPVPPNPLRVRRPGTSVTREPVSGKTVDNRPATAKPQVTFVKKNEETSNDDLHLLQRLSDGTCVKVTNVLLVQPKNKDIVIFDTTQALGKFFILRTNRDVSTMHVEQIATILTETIQQRTIQFFLRQNNNDVNDIIVSCANVSRVERYIQKIEDDGYDEGPPTSKECVVKEGQVMDIGFRGNLRPDSADYRKQFIFNSHIPCTVNLHVHTVDGFAQKSFNSYLGFVQLFTDRLVPHILPLSEEAREKRGTSQKLQQRIVMAVENQLVCDLLIKVPKPEPDPPKPLITAPLSNSPDGPVDKDVLYHISRELGDEWKRLASYLNVKRTRIQAILRQNVNNDNTSKIFDMLTTWSKRLPRAVDRAEILSYALTSCGRGDIAAELRERKNEFKRQQAQGSKESCFRKAFVKVARDQQVTVKWQQLARKLGLTEAEVGQIERERPTSQDRCFSSLQMWRTHSGEEASLRALSQKLRYCRHRQLAREIDAFA